MNVESAAEQLLFVTARLEAETPQGTSTGTAFVYARYVEEGQYPFLVTNKHVVEGATEGRFFFTKGSEDGRPLIGERIDVGCSDLRSVVYGHPDPKVDVAIIPLGQVLNALDQSQNRVFYKSLQADLIPTDESAKDLDALEEVTFVGYPNGIYDVKNLMPIVRQGITATPFQIDYDGEPKFLIDASVFPGSSGSPVFVLNRGFRVDKQGNVNLGGTRALFLGIIAEVATREEEGRIGFEPIPTGVTPVVRTTQMIDLGIVFKASTVEETVSHALRSQGIN